MTYQINSILPLIEKSLSRFSIPATPTSLYDPIRYFMGLPGKRIRPVFVLQSLELFRQPDENDAMAALATELFHNFSLVHDDIMDKADLRRGFQTLHIKWNEPTALLAGDALLVMAYQALLSAKTDHFRELLDRFNQMSLAVCEGQELDMDFSRLPWIELPQYQDMIDRKTAALIAFSFEMGGFLGGAGADSRKALHDFGLLMGRCFQLRDDHLDLFGDEALTGKKKGGDIGNSKLTYPVLMSFQHSDGQAFKEIWQKEGDPSARIQDSLDWMEAHGIPALSEQKIESEMNNGLALLSGVQGDPVAKKHIEELCRQLAFRNK